MKDEHAKNAAQDVAEDVAEDVPQKAAHDLAFGAQTESACGALRWGQRREHRHQRRESRGLVIAGQGTVDGRFPLRMKKTVLTPVLGEQTGMSTSGVSFLGIV